MPIHKPGQRHRYHRILGKRSAKREMGALLNLTAMVDMFTVLVIFLLQNYNVTGEVLYIPKDVILPKAETIKDLKPAIVVTISPKDILIDRDVVANFDTVKNSNEWMIQPLFQELQKALEKYRQDKELGMQNKLRSAVRTNKGLDEPDDPNSWRKVTVQADKGLDFLTIKKVMYTVTEAGAYEINFAVMKQTDTAKP
jgi:biopolymer transport protein ExbD